MVYFLVYFFILLSDGRRGCIKLKGRKEGKEGREGAAKKMFFKIAVFWILFGSENGGSKNGIENFARLFETEIRPHLCFADLGRVAGRVSSGLPFLGRRYDQRFAELWHT